MPTLEIKGKKKVMRKVSNLEFNLATSGHAWLLELEVNNQVVASQLLLLEEPPLLKQQREFRAEHPLQHGGVVKFHPVVRE
jgi:hypothetical protein